MTPSAWIFEPLTNRMVEESHLSFLDDLMRDQVTGCDAKEMLPCQPVHLQSVRYGCAEFNDMMIEERNAYLQRVRHRCSVEVMQHVVDKSELLMKKEGRRERFSVMISEKAGDHISFNDLARLGQPPT